MGVPVFFAMRNWRPFIQTVVPRIRADRIAAICLAPQFSELSVGLYIKRTEEVRDGKEIVWARSYHGQPLLIEAFAERLRPLLPRKVLFTAHSLPEKALTGGDPYAVSAARLPPRWPPASDSNRTTSPFRARE